MPHQIPTTESGNCDWMPELKIFSNGALSTPKLEGIKLAEKYERGGWSGKAITPKQQLWEGDLNTTIQQFWEDNFDTWMRQLFTEEVSSEPFM